MYRRTKVITLISVGALISLALSGCGAAPDASPSNSPAASTFLPCAVSDLTGFNDKDFNELTYDGVKAAADAA